MPVGMMMGAARRRVPSSGGGGGGTSAKATPVFTGYRRSNWALQASTPSNGTGTTVPTANGSNVIEHSTDPLGQRPALPSTQRFLEMHQVGTADQFQDYVRLQGQSPSFITWPQTYWMMKSIACQSTFPTFPDTAFFWSLGSAYWGPPFNGSSRVGPGLIKVNGQNHINLSDGSGNSLWRTPFTKGGWHKWAMRVRIDTTSAGWVEVYYAPWGQPMQIQQFRSAGVIGTLANNNTRINGVTILSNQTGAANSTRIGHYHTANMAGFSGLEPTYFADFALFEDATVTAVNSSSPVSAVDPEF